MRRYPVRVEVRDAGALRVLDGVVEAHTSADARARARALAPAGSAVVSVGTLAPEPAS